MLSVGACLVEDPSKEFYSEIKPISPEYVEEASKVSGFSLEKPAAEGETPVHAMQKLSEWTVMVSDVWFVAWKRGAFRNWTEIFGGRANIAGGRFQ